jgi:superfamily I DNA/RNA helicase
VVDEAQDIGVAELRFLAALGSQRPDALFFAGDLGQRIFQQPFSWKALGVDIRGRSSTLRINYRTSHQIRAQADRLLGPELSDVDGNTESRRGTVSVFNGPPPEILVAESEVEEQALVAARLRRWHAEGIQPHEMAIFVRSDEELPRARAAAEQSGLPWAEIGERMETTHGSLSVSTMHLAKGLEFRAVHVMACDDEVIPSQRRVEQTTEESDLEDVYQTERHLLYVACTRARERLTLSSSVSGSEFLDDMLG